MDSNNWMPSLPKGEPVMDAGDWRTQLPPDSRQEIITKIMETLKKHLPCYGPEEIDEIRRIATRFEEKILNVAINHTDYLRQISMKMLTMEIKPQTAAGFSSPIPAANNGRSMDSSHLLPGNWKTQLPPDSRQKIIKKISETPKKQTPYSRPEELNERRRYASNFEEKIFSGAINHMPTMEIKPQNAAGSSSSIPAANNGTSMDSIPINQGHLLPGDWKTQLLPYSRQKIIERIMERLKRHLPCSGPEEIDEIRRIATRFEEKILDGAINQTDYLRKITMKMLTMDCSDKIAKRI